MKNFIFYLFFFFITVHISAQKFTGKVIDADNFIEISNVYILNFDNDTISISDEKGMFTLTKTGSYCMSSN